MTSNELKTLIDTNLADNLHKDISAEDVRNVLYQLLRKSGGWADYSDSTSTLQSIDAETWTTLTNDGAGIYTNTDFLPYNTTSLFSDNEVQLSGLDLGTQLTLRFDLAIKTLSPSTDVVFRVNIKDSEGNSVYTHNYDLRTFKLATEMSGVNYYTFYVGEAIEDGSLAIELFADHNFQAKLNGIFITIP